MGRMRIGIAGSGGMAAQRAASLAAQPSMCRLSGVFARSPEKAESLVTGTPWFGEFHRLLEASDAVILCVPNDLHDALAEDALSMGKHVLVEYPLTTDAASAQRLAAKAAETGAVLMTGNTMFHESLWTYLQTHAQGLGEIVSAASRVAWHSPDLRGAWYLDPARSGSCFHAFHYHHIALYRRLLGEVSSVSAIDESRTGPHGRSLSGGTMSMRHQSGATSVIQWYLGTGSGGLSRSLDLTGTSGGLSILGMDGDDSTSTAVWHGGGATGRETFGNDWGVAGSTGEFLAAISGNFDHRAQLADDLRCLQIAGCAAESARQGGNWREMGLVL